MFKTVIFDLDGTLINSLEDLAAAVNYGLDVMGYEGYPLEQYRTFVGNGAVKLCERALKKYSEKPEDISRLHTLFSEYYNAHCTDKTKPYPGITNLLQTLKAENITLAVASNKPHDFSVHIVESIFGSEMFSVILGKQENRDTKPAPDIIFEIMKITGADSESTIMVGDSNVDILTAKNAGITSAGCCWGFRSKEELISTGADYTADSADELLNILEN